MVYGLHPACFLSWFNLSEICDFTGMERKATSKDPQDDYVQKTNLSFFHGKFKKYSADLKGESYILKVREADAPELPDVEYVSNRIGEALGLPVAKYFCIHYFGERAFVTKNFVDKKCNTDLSHIYHFQSERKTRDCEALIDIISEETKKFVDIETFIYTCLFDGLIGNHDRHGRNLGFLVTAKGLSLSPIYDNPSSLGLENGEFLKADFNPRGRIPTKNSAHPSAKDYVEEFFRLGYEAQVQTFFSKVKYAKIERIIDESFCTDLMKEALKKLILKRAKEIENAISKRS